MSIRNGMPASELPEVTWRKSRRSGPQGGNCVEVAHLPSGQVAVRNSRHPAGPTLVFTSAEWAAFVGGARDGEFGLAHSPFGQVRNLRAARRAACAALEAALTGEVGVHNVAARIEWLLADHVHHSGECCGCDTYSKADFTAPVADARPGAIWRDSTW